MNITNEEQQDTPMLTKGDLVMASYALAEVFNSFLAAYQEEDYGDGTKEQMEDSMNRIRTAFIKFDGLLHSINQEEDNNDSEDQSAASGKLRHQSMQKPAMLVWICMRWVLKWISTVTMFIELGLHLKSPTVTSVCFFRDHLFPRRDSH